jgi:hypothetical protein
LYSSKLKGLRKVWFATFLEENNEFRQET